MFSVYYFTATLDVCFVTLHYMYSDSMWLLILFCFLVVVSYRPRIVSKHLPDE